MKFSIKDFFSKYDQIRSFLWIWSNLPEKSLIKNLIFCAVYDPEYVCDARGVFLTFSMLVQQLTKNNPVLRIY